MYSKKSTHIHSMIYRKYLNPLRGEEKSVS